MKSCNNKGNPPPSHINLIIPKWEINSPNKKFRGTTFPTERQNVFPRQTNGKANPKARAIGKHGWIDLVFDRKAEARELFTGEVISRTQKEN